MKTNKRLELYQTVTIRGKEQKIDRADHIFKDKTSWFYTQDYIIKQDHETLEIQVKSRKPVGTLKDRL